MSKDLMIAQLNRGSNGAEILQILEVLTSGMDSDHDSGETVEVSEV
jgi:hypothetical protein